MKLSATTSAILAALSLTFAGNALADSQTHWTGAWWHRQC